MRDVYIMSLLGCPAYVRRSMLYYPPWLCSYLHDTIKSDLLVVDLYVHIDRVGNRNQYGAVIIDQQYKIILEMIFAVCP